MQTESQYGKDVEVIRVMSRALEKQLNKLLYDFQKDTGIPVVVRIDEKEREALGRDPEVFQTFEVRAVI